MRAVLYVGVFVLLWQLLGASSDVLFPQRGPSANYPVVALDILFLYYAGWEWWPVIPANALVRWALFAHTVGPVWGDLGVQIVIGGGYAAALRYLRQRLHVALPITTLRDAAWYCAVLGLIAPIAIGAAAVTWLVAAGNFGPGHIPLELTRFALGDVVPIVAIVPAVTAFARWKSLRPPEEHAEAPAREMWLSVAATALLVSFAAYLSALTAEPVLDLSLVAIAWLAIRYGSRGAALGTVTAYVVTSAANLLLDAPTWALVQSQGILYVSSAMALLLSGMTSERWELLARLVRRAYVDELTGLPNRERLVEWIDQRQGDAVVLVILDLDDMRLLNQGVGRAAADRLLQELAIRLRSAFPSTYFVARVSADEFAVALVDDRSPHAIMTELRSFFDVPFEAEGSRIFVSASMGAVRMVRTVGGDEMLRKADLALDRAKTAPSRAIVYSPDLYADETPSLVGELHRAVELEELAPFFQPIFRYDPETRRWIVAGAEALLRWIHPERGIVVPASFISLLERLAIGDHVGWWVLDRALAYARVWRGVIPEFRVWVNLFARQVVARDAAGKILAALERAGLPGDALVIEISEQIVASDERDVAALVAELKRHGVAAAIDDFGTGGSSLGRVRHVPADVLKIDRSFVAMSEVDAKARAVAATVVRLAVELGMTVVAEGVENPMQLQVMNETGCTYVQGYALGHPLPADLFARTFVEFAIEAPGA
jgi:diguanylate cyclase (GGDEF)-like protein